MNVSTVSTSKLKIVMMFILGFFILFQGIAVNGSKSSNVVLKAMSEELARSMKVLGEKGPHPLISSVIKSPIPTGYLFQLPSGH